MQFSATNSLAVQALEYIRTAHSHTSLLAVQPLHQRLSRFRQRLERQPTQIPK